MSRLILLGVGTAGASRHAPAGLLLEYGQVRIGFDGGPGSEPPENVHAWLVSDPFDPLQEQRRALAHATGMPEPAVSPYDHGALRIAPLPLSGHAYGYRISTGTRTAIWAPHTPHFPAWASAADLMFGAEAVAASARSAGVRRLVLTVPAEHDGSPLGAEWGEEGRAYRL
ncbi:hypothetical protein GCM10027589_56390 [Actinocorallia lasiicapitis]